MAYGKSRGSNRLKESERMRIIDESSRKRRLRKLHETLEADNHHDDPFADLVMSKKLPKFEDSLEGRTRKKKERTAEYFHSKYRRSFAQFIEEDAKDAAARDRVAFYDISAPSSKFPPFNICAVCGYQSNYNCISCGVKVCQAKCFGMHFETRCLKWAS